MSDDNNIDGLLQEFEPVGEQNVTNVNNEFLQSLSSGSCLKLLQRAQCIKKLKAKGYSGLVSLFVSDPFIDQIWKFTNAWLIQKGYKKCTKRQFRAYVGLEMAMSIIQFNDIKSYWKERIFVGQQDFKSTMSRNCFQQIRGSLCTYDPDKDYKAKKSSKDPLWHSRVLMEHFQKNCVAVAVPLGTVALDEAGFCTKARSKECDA